ncbi:MAG: 5-formyltetrahydrofolate cyclo-ligase, partial [Oscillospiraceae bacterium]|nr:5-formyltetrahydrofolate cyclo-ligase [Oscillospiraceae bacterium]
IPEEIAAFQDKKICERFMALVTYRYAEALLMYAPHGSEIDVSHIARHALQSGKIVAYPRCDTQGYTMDYHIINSFDELEKGAYGIMEPLANLPVYDIDSGLKTVCIVPALVYDRHGYRIGYGKGYYDRFLAGFKGARVGLVYNDFIVSNVPRGRYDLAVDVLVTEKGVKALNG